MSANNGVIRIGRKGIKKFAFGEDGEPFEVDVVVAFQEWIGIDESIRQSDGPDKGLVPTEDMPRYHHAAVAFVTELARQTHTPPGKQPPPVPDVTVAEALDFIARLREQYDELADFFVPKKRKKAESPDTSEVELRFSAEVPLTPFDELVLSMVMDRTQAWELLNDPQYCGALDTVGMYRTMLRAGYTEAEAQRAASHRGWLRLEANMVM